MITVEEVIQIHLKLIQQFGGSSQLRDISLLDSAINRPFQTFDKEDLYPSPIDKSAAVFESLIINHPFVDGNKRIAYVLMRLVLLQYDLDIVATQEVKYDFVIKAAKGELDFEGIRKWIFSRIIQK